MFQQLKVFFFTHLQLCYIVWLMKCPIMFILHIVLASNLSDGSLWSFLLGVSSEIIIPSFTSCAAIDIQIFHIKYN